MNSSGRWLILALAAVCLTASGFSWWFRWSATHRAAEFWGAEAAATIRDAKRVEALRLSETPQNLPRLAGEQEDEAVTRLDASGARGLLHLKQALLEDRSFLWGESFPVQDFRPRYGLVFHPPAGDPAASPVTLLFDDSCTQCVSIAGEGAPRPIVCQPIAAGLRRLFADWFAR